MLHRKVDNDQTKKLIWYFFVYNIGPSLNLLLPDTSGICSSIFSSCLRHGSRQVLFLRTFSLAVWFRVFRISDLAFESRVVPFPKVKVGGTLVG